MSQYPIDYFASFYGQAQTHQNESASQDTTQSQERSSDIRPLSTPTSSIRPGKTTVRRSHSYSTPSPPSTSSSSGTRLSRIRFVDASYRPPERRASDSSTIPGSSSSGGWNSRRRKVITSYQLEKLLEVFERGDSPSIEIRERLGAELDMTPREVQVWFQNRRAKVKREREATSSVAEESTSPAVVSPESAERISQATSGSTEPTWINPFSSSFSYQQPTRGYDHFSPTPHTRVEPTQPPSGPWSDSRAATESPRYRQIFGERRISLPTVPLSRFPSPSPTHSDNSTNSSKSSSYFPNRILPSPSTSFDTSPLATFDRLSICSPHGPYHKERDPFFPHIPAPCSRRESENQELIQLPPILEAIPSSSLTSDAHSHKLASALFHPRGRMSVEDLLNPSLPLARRSSNSAYPFSSPPSLLFFNSSSSKTAVSPASAVSSPCRFD
ncbi:hypothetical protein JCM3765_000290 [Sporobolomyces pararoseus]